MIVLKDNLVKIGNSAVIGSGFRRFHPNSQYRPQIKTQAVTNRMSNMKLSGSGLVGKNTVMKKKTINFL